MANLDKIFKSYDVRGEYPAELNEEIAYKIGLAYGNFIGKGPIAVGQDGRISGPALAKALMKGIAESGLDVWDIGLISTDMIYFASGFYGLGGGIITTASHNPSNQNGFKFCRDKAIPLSGKVGLDKIKEMIEEGPLKGAKKPGKVIKKDIYKDYFKKILTFVDSKKIKPYKVVVDASNGVEGYVLEKFQKYLPIKIIPLYFQLDGNFPNHLPNPIEEENQRDCQKKVEKVRADLGICFDGDGDRMFIIDEKGQTVSGTLTTAMVTIKMLENHKGNKILHNLVCGRIVGEIIKQYGGKPVQTKVGHSIIKQNMRDEDGLFAGEHSGHYYFRDFYYADSGLIATLIVMELMSEQNKPLSQILQPLKKYYWSGEINSEIGDGEDKIKELIKKYKDGKQSTFDGLKVDYKDWWFSVRTSHTEPLIRLNVEANSKELMEEKRDELLEIIRKAQ
jgi:phosphomannomutase